MADLERLTLAAEAARTVYPPKVAALIEQLKTAAHGLAAVMQKDKVSGPTPGERYAAAQCAFTDAARHLIAPDMGRQMRTLFGVRR